MRFITRTIASYDIIAVCFDKTENKVVNVTFSTIEEVTEQNALSIARDFIENKDKNLSVIMVNTVTKNNALYRVSVNDFLALATKVKDVENDGGIDE